MNLIQIKSLSDENGRAVFEKNGYTRIRIPGLITLKNGVMLCCFECRRGGDWSPIDIGMQCSTDGGLHWSAPEILVSGKGRNTMHNPVMIPDGNRIHFLYCENYKRLFYSCSDDNGRHFSEARELTTQIEAQTKHLFWSVIAVGPGHGIRLKDGTLLVPVWFGQNPDDMFAHHPSVIAVLRSVDRGDHWQLSPLIGENSLKDPSECCIAEVGERVILNIRNENRQRLRAVSCSYNAGRTWSSPVFMPSLPDPVCCAGICAVEEKLYFSNCASAESRIHLTVKELSADGCVADAVHVSDVGGYSDLSYHRQSGSLIVIFENETNGLKAAQIQL